MSKRILALLMIALLALAACQRQPEVIPTVRPTITPSPMPSETPIPSVTVEATATSEATAEATAEDAEATATPSAKQVADAMLQEVVVEADGEVVIGLAAALSGEGLAPLGIDIQRGAELALAARPVVTVDGVEFTVVLDAQDDTCSADGGQAVASRFASDEQVVGVVGPMCSSACRAAAPIFDAAGYTTISPSCTAADLTTSDYSSFNRAVVSDAFQGVIAAEYIYNTLGVSRIATIHDGSPYGEGLVRVMSARFEELGGEIVAADAIAVGDTDFRGLLEDIAQEQPDLIYFAGFPAEAARIAEQRGDTGLEDVIMMGADGIRTQEFIDLAGDSAEGVLASTSIAASSEALDAFLALYVETYGEEPPAPFHANAFDATKILLDAIEATASVNAEGELVIDRAAISAHVRALADYQGLTGVLNADGTGELSVADIGISRVTEGAFVQIAIGSIDDETVVITETEQ
ncbi:MAG: branched-chain amino acid ABC transporter substrate-binding protein [Chloroflexota bacterium]|nr:branched-chain amino acid ABC transporter substrate-binding protein [Chloroflexota bacterium]